MFKKRSIEDEFLIKEENILDLEKKELKTKEKKSKRNKEFEFAIVKSCFIIFIITGIVLGSIFYIKNEIIDATSIDESKTSIKEKTIELQSVFIQEYNKCEQNNKHKLFHFVKSEDNDIILEENSEMDSIRYSYRKDGIDKIEGTFKYKIEYNKKGNEKNAVVYLEHLLVPSGWKPTTIKDTKNNCPYDSHDHTVIVPYVSYF